MPASVASGRAAFGHSGSMRRAVSQATMPTAAAWKMADSTFSATADSPGHACIATQPSIV